ncbi:MAG: DUF4332 domain-containing protein [Acidobacteriota bacterium]
MGYKIADIEGVGTTYAEKLGTMSIATTEDLLKHTATPGGRQQLSQRTGISEALILKWSNHADMMRISGVGPQFAELLEASGVDTVKELRNRNPQNLAQRMKEVNEAKGLAKASPADSTVQKWVEQARHLPTVMIF